MKYFLTVALVVLSACQKPPINFQPNDLPPGDLVFQPQFFWAGDEVSRQGTGFFTKSAAGKLIAVTSAHFVDFGGPKLLRAQWLRVDDGEKVAEFEEHLGTPTYAGNEDDYRRDYLLFVPKQGIEDIATLELDGRMQPLRGERVWLPNKDYESDKGYTLEAGTVKKATAEYSQVVFDNQFVLQSRSGSPIISQMTGNVIGTLAASGEFLGEEFVVIAPSAPIKQALERANKSFKTHAVIGR